MTAPALEVVGVDASYPTAAGRHPVLFDVTFAATQPLTAVLGPSGCGKSTLLRVVAGLHAPDAGSVTVQGEAVAGPGVRSVAPEKRGVGLVPQDGALFPHLDVARNVGYGLRGPRAARTRRVAEVLELVDLADLAARRPHELSGGQRQRVALARALAPRPRLLLLDEPFASLDAALRTDLRAEVRTVLAASGTPAVLVTHDQDEALSLADEVLVLRDGRVVQHGPPELVYSEPADAWVAGFVGESVHLAGANDGTVLRCVLGTLPSAGMGWPVGEVDVVVRPEQLGLSLDDDGVPGRLVQTQYFGHDALHAVEVEADSGAVVVTVRTQGAGPHRPGDRVAVRLLAAPRVLARAE